MIKALIIDDDAVDRKILKRGLASAGVEATVEEAVDGTFGLQYLLSKQFDCVFVDYDMPMMNGLEVVRRARKSGIRTPIIMVSANKERALRCSLPLVTAGQSSWKSLEDLGS